ncbi:hypothetical protein X961_4094 [Burkholderia pseudomallei MSHR5613]|nr:hypothetical protein DM75_1845 [Burkholderia mallei]KGC80684.1 hypothetical protein DO71_4628 [Burkholderia pseudomallei]KGS01372.1 hypothetical protein X948_3132 [Burkholderia pseudomallei MSHR5608]KGS25354.1 hypothetical protein X941_4705 [Burkholderia pseudomallei MSHR5569]KGS42964.1 hypothetical protein X992_4349 [Burkholderia pseudomallei MSHR5492]KGS47790.1 hypothetical protein X961_4094 [Burkholderia pseudomallei MSHR5613]KGS56925.1 hypothetical protein X949_4022 [Burkholderia pseud
MIGAQSNVISCFLLKSNRRHVTEWTPFCHISVTAGYYIGGHVVSFLTTRKA